jgi:hypothetical protein
MTTDGRPSLFHYGNPGETHTAQVRRGPRISGAKSHVSTTIDPTYLEKGGSHWSLQVRTAALCLQGPEGLCSFVIPVTTRHHSHHFQERDASHTRLSHSLLTPREEPPRGSSVPIRRKDPPWGTYPHSSPLSSHPGTRRHSHSPLTLAPHTQRGTSEGILRADLAGRILRGEPTPTHHHSRHTRSSHSERNLRGDPPCRSRRKDPPWGTYPHSSPLSSHSLLTLREEPPRGSSVPISPEGSSVENLHPLFTSRNKAPTAKPYRTHQPCHKPKSARPP